MPRDSVRSPLQPLTFLQQYGLPAFRCFVAGCLPYALLRAIVLINPVFFQMRPNKRILGFYAVHAWGLFMLILAGIILYLGMSFERPVRSILKPSPPPHS